MISIVSKGHLLSKTFQTHHNMLAIYLLKLQKYNKQDYYVFTHIQIFGKCFRFFIKDTHGLGHILILTD